MHSTAVPAIFPSEEGLLAASDGGLFQKVRTWFLLLLLFLIIQANGLFSKADLAASLDTVSSSLEHNSLFQLMNVVMIVLGFALMFSRLKSCVKVLVAERMILGIILLCFLSVMWSQVPQITMRKALIMAFTVLLGVYFSTQLTVSQQKRILIASGLIAAIGSLVLIVVFPEYGRMGYSGEWKGIFWHKNELSQGMELLFCPLLFTNLRSGRERQYGYVCLFLALLLMIGSEARTPAILALVVIVIAFWGRMFRKAAKSQYSFILLMTAICTVLFCAFLLMGFNTLVVLLGKDPTLSGRTTNWLILIPFTLHHLWLGYGYQAFWTGAYGDSGTALAGMRGAMRTADNGYLDFVLEFGIVGLVLLCFVLYFALRDFYLIMRGGKTPQEAFWYIAYIAEAMIGNLSASYFYSGGIRTFLFVVACLGLRNTRIQVQGLGQRTPEIVSPSA